MGKTHKDFLKKVPKPIFLMKRQEFLKLARIRPIDTKAVKHRMRSGELDWDEGKQILHQSLLKGVIDAIIKEFQRIHYRAVKKHVEQKGHQRKLFKSGDLPELAYDFIHRSGRFKVASASTDDSFSPDLVKLIIKEMRYASTPEGENLTKADWKDSLEDMSDLIRGTVKIFKKLGIRFRVNRDFSDNFEDMNIIFHLPKGLFRYWISLQGGRKIILDKKGGSKLTAYSYPYHQAPNKVQIQKLVEAIKGLI